MKTIHINDDIHHKFALHAIMEKKTKIKLVEEIINEYLKKNKHKLELFLKNH